MAHITSYLIWCMSAITKTLDQFSLSQNCDLQNFFGDLKLKYRISRPNWQNRDAKWQKSLFHLAKNYYQFGKIGP